MAKITITVDIDGSAVSREYDYADGLATSEKTWGGRVQDMLDTIHESKTIPF